MTYEYECQRCGDRFEWEQAITDGPLGLCIHPVTDADLPLAGQRVRRDSETGEPRITCTLTDGRVIEVCSGPLRRLLFAPGHVLKGKRWGRDGYSG